MLGMALAALAALAAVVGGAATSVTLCGEGFHTDAQASAKSCAAAVGEHVRGDYLRNLGGMSQTEYQLACCAENKCAPWTETFGADTQPQGYELLNPGGSTASALGALCADGYEGEPVAVCPVAGGPFAPLRGCAPRPLPSRLHPVPVDVVAEWDARHGPKSPAELYWLAKLEIGYFFLLGAAAVRVAFSLGARLCDCLGAPSRLGVGSLIYCAALATLAACCAFATWTEIIRFIYEDIDVHGGSAAYWFAHSRVFVRAYIAVTDTAAGWWWSSQLLMFVAPLMLFFRVHALRHPEPAGIPVLAYALLGFLGAISLATPLFLLEVALRSRVLAGADAASRKTEAARLAGVPAMPAYTAGALVLSMACALLLPAALVVRDEAGAELPYNVLLIAVHDALMVAALPFGWRLVGSSSSSSDAGAQSRGLLLFAAAAGSLAAGSHLLNSADIVRELLRSSVIATTPQDVLAAIVGGGFPAANACQASISTDVVGTAATVVLYIVASAAGVTQEAVLHSGSSSGGSSKSGRGVVYALCFCAAVPVLSLCGACCALVLLREWAVGAPPQEAAAAPIAVKEKVR
jgi:hypothetical protein